LALAEIGAHPDWWPGPVPIAYADSGASSR
jgi:hypothetical protein